MLSNEEKNVIAGKAFDAFESGEFFDACDCIKEMMVNVKIQNDRDEIEEKFYEIMQLNGLR